MKANGIAQEWGSRFGLAVTPLFEANEEQPPGKHTVLLDGGYGTFALSQSDVELWRTADPAAWSWSSDISHHVCVTEKKVGVTRWDRPQNPKIYDRTSVEHGLDRFYAYLVEDRLRSNKNVVSHLLGLFRRLRSLAHAAEVSDEHATNIFAATLATMVAPDEARSNPELFGVDPEAFTLISQLDQRGWQAVVDNMIYASGSLSDVRLLPNLTIRHAAGLLFQEAHFDLLHAPDTLDLFGLVGASSTKPQSRGGTHFTPPALARSVVEQVLGALPSLIERDELTLCDPACGSAAFLHEAIRALRRLGFNGKLKLIGQDQSSAAISMAKFVLLSSLRDWSPKGGYELQLSIGDSLGELGIPPADVMVMNPPFIAFGAQSPLQREQLRSAMGTASAARGDYSMAFVIRALEALKPGGVLGALFPSSLLSLQAAGSWRARLLDAGELRLLASIGDFGLFTHAIVQVACAVVRKSPAPAGHEFTALVTGNETRATGEALRWLRKAGSKVPTTPITEQDWTLFPVSTEALRERDTWRLPSPEDERILRVLKDKNLPCVGDLFEVNQGVQTGLNDALLLTDDEFRNLPAKERRFFKAATMSDSIQGGVVVKPYWVFFPHTQKGPLFADEAAVRCAAPKYYQKYLEVYRDRLINRATIRRSGRQDWWGLMHPRNWSVSSNPRIISKFFGGEGAFFGDLEAEFVPVMGHIWLPKARIAQSKLKGLSINDVLSAYVSLFNSKVFVKLLSLYSPHVAGGQFDLSSRHVSQIPLPDLHASSWDLRNGRAVSYLAETGKFTDKNDASTQKIISQLVTDLYGAPSLSDF